MATKRTYQPSKIKRVRTHGFLVRLPHQGRSSRGSLVAAPRGVISSPSDRLSADAGLNREF